MAEKRPKLTWYCPDELTKDWFKSEAAVRDISTTGLFDDIILDWLEKNAIIRPEQIHPPEKKPKYDSDETDS